MHYLPSKKTLPAKQCSGQACPLSTNPFQPRQPSIALSQWLDRTESAMILRHKRVIQPAPMHHDARRNPCHQMGAPLCTNTALKITTRSLPDKYTVPSFCFCFRCSRPSGRSLMVGCRRTPRNRCAATSYPNTVISQKLTDNRRPHHQPP